MTLSLEEMKANRRKWVEALRSGKYRQGRNRLHDADGRMCCLGVLCDITGVEWVQLRDGYSPAGGQSMYPGPSIREFVGLRTSAGEFGPEGERKYLANLNDKGASFAEIAAIIESEPPGLFIDSTPTGSAS